MAHAAGLACEYGGTTKITGGGAGATAGITYDGNIKLVATGTVTDFQRANVMINKGIRYAPSGTLAAALPGTPCAISPASTMFDASAFVGDFIIGIEPRIIGASCITNVPNTALVCGPQTAPLSTQWPWLLITGSPYTCGAPLADKSTNGDATSTWNLSAIK
jgi:hypothetical protein